MLTFLKATIITTIANKLNYYNYLLKLTKTIICQAHLAPLPLHVVPIYWNYDYVMRLYPLPDLIVIADKNQMFTQKHAECHVINPVIILVLNKNRNIYIFHRLIFLRVLFLQITFHLKRTCHQQTRLKIVNCQFKKNEIEYFYKNFLYFS